jgi:hypothetical protein
MSDEMRKIDVAMKEIDDLLNDPDDVDLLGSDKMAGIHAIMDQVENEIDHHHLKKCTKSDQERIHLQLKCISNSFQIQDIMKNFNRDLFEQYNCLKEEHNISDLQVSQAFRKNSCLLLGSPMKKWWREVSNKTTNSIKPWRVKENN